VSRVSDVVCIHRIGIISGSMKGGSTGASATVPSVRARARPFFSLRNISWASPNRCMHRGPAGMGHRELRLAPYEDDRFQARIPSATPKAISPQTELFTTSRSSKGIPLKTERFSKASNGYDSTAVFLPPRTLLSGQLGLPRHAPMSTESRLHGTTQYRFRSSMISLA
jgi:hypothetical protein